MNILNRYVLKKFLQPFFASFFGLCVLLLVAQVFDRLDKFLSHDVSWRYVVGYLGSAMPLQAYRIVPVACLLATLFVIGNLARTKEYIAGLAGGIPPEKFLSGILIAGVSISLVAMIFNETLVPPATEYATRVFQDKIKHLGEWRQSVVNDLFVSGTDGRLWSAKIFNLDQGTMERVIVDTYANGQVGPQIDAKNAVRQNDGWLFREGVLRRFDTDNRGILSIEPFKEMLLPYPERPSDLAVEDPDAEAMNYSQLKRLIKRMSALGINTRKLQVELMMKMAFPFACFVVTFLGIPLAISARGNKATGIAAAAALTIAYLGFIQFGKALAQNQIPPWLGAWLGNIVFCTIGAYLWARMRRTA